MRTISHHLVRSDANENNLKASAYEAINEFIQSAENAECLKVVSALVPVFLGRLEKSFTVQVRSLSCLPFL